MFFQNLLKNTKECSVKIERLPVHILKNLLGKINPENNHDLQKQQNKYIKTEIKIENHDNLDDPIYKDSVSFFFSSLILFIH